MQRAARTELSQAQLERTRLFDRIGREVAEAHARIQAQRREMEIARQRVDIAQRGFNQELLRAKNVLMLPIEVLLSVNQLAAARQDLVRAMVGYSQAQLQLFVALGNAPASDP